ncbi:MAG TPA: hypothetical protein VF933_21295 [Streptosporangiaceae bacterium]
MTDIIPQPARDALAAVPAAIPGGASVPSRLGNLVDVLSGALATWAARDDSKVQPEVRQSANVAMDAIDAILGKLHEARSALITEIRASDGATDARIDAMLAVPLEERLAARAAEIRCGAR